MKRARLSILLALSCAACGAATVPVTEPSEPEAEPPPRYAVALRFEEGEPSPEGTPRTRVSLVRIAPGGERSVSELRVEDGACYHRDEPGVLIAGVCWWAGSGARYVIRREGESIIALRAEATGDDTYGELTELTRIDVPAEAALDLLGAR